MTEDHDDELLNTLEAARVLGVDRDKVYRLIHGGVLPARKYGRTFRLRRGDVEGVADRLRPRQAKRERKPWGPARARRTITLQPPEFVPMTPEQEQHAIDVLADILADYLVKTGRVPGEAPGV